MNNSVVGCSLWAEGRKGNKEKWGKRRKGRGIGK